MSKYITPDHIRSEDVKLIRDMLGMTQREFADFTNVSKRTVERWESTEDEIAGPITVLVDMIVRNHDIPQKLTIPEKKYRMRLWFMYRRFVCTIIDVDELERKVEVHNYITNPIYRAFGVNTEPTFEEYGAPYDYQEF